MTRRNVLLAAATAALPGLSLGTHVPVGARSRAVPGLSSRLSDDFVTQDDIYLNNAGIHPLVRPAAEAMRRYAESRAVPAFPPGFSLAETSEHVRAAFARLINADPSEIALVQSTISAENAVAEGLNLRGDTRGNVVTDDLHHEGSLYMYDALQRNGLEVRMVRSESGHIDPERIVAAIDGDTRLVAISLVSWVNGFRHDLDTICRAAHANGAMVYADIIQAAGAIPIDVKASGVDFCGCGTYKWLMGETGLGLFYARREHIGTRLPRTAWGWVQLKNFTYHIFPYDPPGKQPMTWESRPDAEGHYAVGTPSFPAIAAASESLGYILKTGVDNIRDHVQPLISRLQDALPALGYVPMTPQKNIAPIVTYLVGKPESLAKRLAAAGIRPRLRGHQLRISPSIYNTEADIDALIDVMRDHALKT